MVNVILGGTIDTKGQGNAQKNGPGGQRRVVKTEETPHGKIVELLPSLQMLTKDLEQEVKSGKLQLSMGARGLTISFTQAALFPSGGDEISPDFNPTIDKIAHAMKQVPNPVRTEGHTDSVPIHNSRFKSNWELSAARSIALVELFMKMGVARERLSIAGYAETAPVDSNETEEGRQKNRRVDIVILNEKGLQGEPERPTEPPKPQEKKPQSETAVKK